MIFGSIPVSAKDYRFTDDRNKMVLEKLASGAPELKEALKSYNSGDHKSAFEKVANYFSAKMSERFFFDHSKLDTEIKDYREFFPDKQKQHAA